MCEVQGSGELTYEACAQSPGLIPSRAFSVPSSITSWSGDLWIGNSYPGIVGQREVTYPPSYKFTCKCVSILSDAHTCSQAEVSLGQPKAVHGGVSHIQPGTYQQLLAY